MVLIAVYGYSFRRDVEDGDMDAISSLDPRDPDLRKRSDEALAAILGDLGGAPSLDDYRKVYDTQGWPWPGEEQIRDTYPVASSG
jgi:hypothetical protein